MEDYRDYIERIYNEARRKGLCRNQQDFADLLGANPSTISGAMKGKEKYLTRNLVRRVKAWAEQVLNIEDAAPRQEPPKPDIVIPAATAALYNNMSETIRIQAEIIARLQGASAGLGGAVAYQKNYRIDG